jgi:hypothetical protein
VSPGNYRGEVCAVTDEAFDCESIIVVFTSVEEKEVIPTTNSEPEKRSTYASQLQENIVTVVVLSIILLLVTVLGWKRPKAPVKLEQSVNYDNTVPGAPDLSMWSK